MLKLFESTSEDCDFQFYTFCLFFKREKHGYWRSEPNSRMFSWTMIKHLFICSCHWHVFVVSCRRRSSTSSKSSSRAWPNCGRPWWTRPSTCFSSKWRLNWNRLKTNWSRPKMNWVPGNLHLIGKDNQNNPPQKTKQNRKVKTSSRPPPSLSLQTCRNNGGGEGWQSAVLTTRFRLYRKPVTPKKTKQTPNCFCTLALCQLHIT